MLSKHNASKSSSFVHGDIIIDHGFVSINDSKTSKRSRMSFFRKAILQERYCVLRAKNQSMDSARIEIYAAPSSNDDVLKFMDQQPPLLIMKVENIIDIAIFQLKNNREYITIKYDKNNVRKEINLHFQDEEVLKWKNLLNEARKVYSDVPHSPISIPENEYSLHDELASQNLDVDSYSYMLSSKSKDKAKEPSKMINYKKQNDDNNLNLKSKFACKEENQKKKDKKKDQKKTIHKELERQHAEEIKEDKEKSLKMFLKSYDAGNEQTDSKLDVHTKSLIDQSLHQKMGDTSSASNISSINTFKQEQFFGIPINPVKESSDDLMCLNLFFDSNQQSLQRTCVKPNTKFGAEILRLGRLVSRSKMKLSLSVKQRINQWKVHASLMHRIAHFVNELGDEKILDVWLEDTLVSYAESKLESESINAINVQSSINRPLSKLELLKCLLEIIYSCSKKSRAVTLLSWAFHSTSEQVHAKAVAIYWSSFVDHRGHIYQKSTKTPCGQCQSQLSLFGQFLSKYCAKRMCCSTVRDMLIRALVGTSWIDPVNTLFDKPVLSACAWQPLFYVLRYSQCQSLRVTTLIHIFEILLILNENANSLIDDKNWRSWVIPTLMEILVDEQFDEDNKRRATICLAVIHHAIFFTRHNFEAELSETLLHSLSGNFLQQFQFFLSALFSMLSTENRRFKLRYSHSAWINLREMCKFIRRFVFKCPDLKDAIDDSSSEMSTDESNYSLHAPHHMWLMKDKAEPIDAMILGEIIYLLHRLKITRESVEKYLRNPRCNVKLGLPNNDGLRTVGDFVKSMLLELEFFGSARLFLIELDKKRNDMSIDQVNRFCRDFVESTTPQARQAQFESLSVFTSSN